LETDDARIRPAASEVERLWCDNTRIRALTGYAPQVSLREGLARTIAWFGQQENLRRYKADIYNL
jgi:nucleoside-diphosphate-sugar epimerase